MPISPNVQAHMMQGQQPQEASTAEQLFAKSFSDQAFTALKSKFPSLVSVVVTFKTLSTDVEKGDAIGAFVLVSGDNVRYVPVTMVSGNMGSCCEMMYDKESDLFEPLSDENVKRLLAAVEVSDPTILRKSTRVEDTRNLFRNMVRPPASSNVVMASSRDGVSALPNAAKQLVADHFMANPELLAKIASFYPVEYLASKLAKTAEQPVVAQDIPEVIKISDLTKEAAEKLSEEHKKEVLDKGYTVIDGTEAASTLVLGLDDPAHGISDSLGVEEWPARTENLASSSECCVSDVDMVGVQAVRKGKVLAFSNTGFSKKDALFTNKHVFLEGACVAETPCLVSGVCNDVSAEDIRKYAGAMDVDELDVFLKKEDCYGDSFIVFVPSRSGGWNYAGMIELTYDHENPVITHADGVWAINGFCERKYIVSSAITCGVLKTENTCIYPETALFVPRKGCHDNKVLIVRSMSSLVDTVTAMSRPIKVIRDGVDIRIQDTRAEKTASFASDADAAAYLQSEYGLKSAQIADVLGSRSSLLYKAAFDYGSLDLMQQPGYIEQQAPQMLPSMPEAHSFNPAMLADYADFEDPELMDTGILSTFADDPDIRSLLTDYLQDFMEQQDKLGRIILIFSINKRELEDMYGIDKLSSILGSCRKIFKFIGELVSNIRQYTSMAAV